MSDVEQFVDGRQIPPLALLAAPLEGREIVPRQTVRRDVLFDDLHVLPAVGTVRRPHRPQVGLAESAPGEVNLVQRDDQPVPPVFRKAADDAPHAVPVVQLADLVALDDILLAAAGLRTLRRFGRRQFRRRDAFGIILHLAVGITDVGDLFHGQHVGRTCGIRKFLIADRIGRDFDHLGLDPRSVGLDDQILRSGRQHAAKRCEQQQECFFHLQFE